MTRIFLICLKSIFAGIAALVSAALVTSLIFTLRNPVSANQWVGYNPTGLLQSPVFWLVLLVIFAGGYYLGFRKFSH